MEPLILPRDSGFGALLKRQAETRPERPALLSAQEDCPCSYRQLYDKALARAELLRSSGKSCLGLICDGSLACVVELFGAVLAGMQVVLLDGMLPEERLIPLIRATDIDALWSEDGWTEELSPYLTHGVREGAGRILFFTSGTTGSARAVVLTEQSLCASAWNGSALLPLREDDTLLNLLPLNHVFGFVCGLLWGLSCGACVALSRGPRYYAEDLARFSPTAISVVPLLLGFLLRQNALNPDLRLVLIGAGDCPPALPAALKQRGIRVSFGYGLTETSSGVALSLGEDPYAMQLCPDFRVQLAQDGEILIESTPCMMQGYYRDAEATAAVLQGGVLHTGDLGRFGEDGLLRITGRKKEILVFPDGTKLYLPEYEEQLRGLLPERDFAVIARDGGPALWLRGRPEERESIAAALEPLMRTLPLSRRLKAIYLDPAPLPRTASGKIQRWILQQKVEST